MLKEYVLHRSILGEGWAEYSSNNTENHCFFCLKKRLYTVKSVFFTFLCVMFRDTALKFMYFMTLYMSSFGNQTNWLSKMSYVVSVLWSTTIDCYLWGWIQNIWGRVRYQMCTDFFFHFDGDFKSCRTYINCCLVDPARLVSALCSSLDNYSDLSSKLRYYLQWNNCTWLRMSFYTR